ncbi:RING finger protein 10 isoform X2 [Toxorhynchites rutilus septentrionalis]|uniref:RING finger protein 10 isoform X2 n=1 Tax=Toxorhynchites rutilus septentrionalis TaxID=329112 RepID=UPI002478847B|nr:RING finger protein 10 isoform X2 [Toxorhynchites rutilus septentrionalis]
MEKNRFSNQSLPKGQIADSKKSQASAKWPRHSKRREQPNFNGSKSDNYRNSKATTTGKARSQTNFNYDKRSRQRPEAVGELFPEAAASAVESFDQDDVQHEGTGLASSSNGGLSHARHELHSVFSPGSKKQSLNFLLNFHYAPRERDQPMRFSKTGNNRCYVRKTTYNKEQFLQATCQFVVRADEDYTDFLASPDQLVDWANVEQVHVLSSEEPQCPICLYPPVASKMTKCGHVFCWPCILHYLALSDKTWRKCPICYDAIHLPELRSAVSKPFHSFVVGDIVNFQLMRRKKNSMNISIVSGNIVENVIIPRYNSFAENTILTKLLLVDTTGILNIIKREQQELENQIVIEGVDCPENVFVQQALDQLEQRKETIMKMKPISFPMSSQKMEISTQPRVNAKHSIDEKDTVSTESTLNAAACVQHSDFLIDEESNFSLSDIDIVPTASSDYFYFYQSTDGQPLYLHSINTRMLQVMYGSLDKSPLRFRGKIVHKDSCSMCEDLRKRLKYLQHLPVCTQFEVVEIEIQSNVISPDVLAQFKDEIKNRRQNRQKRARAERIREKKIFEINERKMGKALSRFVDIDSTKHFPVWSKEFNFPLEPALAVNPSTSTSTTTKSGLTASGSSWSKMLSNSTNASRWPSLPPATATAEATSTSLPQTLIQAKDSATHSKSEGDYKEAESLEESQVRSETKTDLTMVIGAALEKATLNSDTNSGENSKTSNITVVNETKHTGTKKKKNKKTLLLLSGMKLN